MILKKYYIFLILSLIIAACGSAGGSDSPSNAVKDFVVAIKDGNPAKAWSYLSVESKKMYDEQAKNRNESGQEFFVKGMKDSKSLGVLGTEFDVVNEVKEGDNKATITVKTFKGQETKLYAIKEGGTWYLDYARSIEESRKLVE
ncbi:MAG TPA: DUF4878 domain-containing protein [Ignavibacteria bacterium]|nr:DUF4878 domain-containing protein [Ignavibacteria bacterium]